MAATADPTAPAPSATESSSVALRLPSVYANAAPPSPHGAPAPDWLAGRWYITHSSLPLWKDKRDVCVSYTVLPVNSAGVSRIEDCTTYRALNAAKVKELKGANAPAGGHGHAGSYDWRGYGFLKVATSHWEVLGHGGGEAERGRQWVVTHFSKTLFTPEGIDIYARQPEGLPAELVEEIKTGLRGLEHENFKKLVDALFEVRHDKEEAGTS